MLCPQGCLPLQYHHYYCPEKSFLREVEFSKMLTTISNKDILDTIAKQVSTRTSAKGGLIYHAVLCLVPRLCPTLCEPMAYSPPGSSVHGILQAEYWSELPFPSPGDLCSPGIKPGSPALQADSLPSEPPGKPLSKMLLP